MLYAIERLCQLASKELLYFFLNEQIVELVEFYALHFIRYGNLEVLSGNDSKLQYGHFHRLDTLLTSLLGKLNCQIVS